MERKTEDENNSQGLRKHIKAVIVQHGVTAVVTALIGAFEDEAARTKPESHEHRRFMRLAQKAHAMHDE